MDKNVGYEIKWAVLFDDNGGIALGEHSQAPDDYVTWRFWDAGGKRDYYWGHYHNNKSVAMKDLMIRSAEYQRQFSVKVVQIEAPGRYKYYSTQRPVDIGTFPKPSHNAPDEIVNYDRRIPVEGSTFQAWGHLTYTRPLTEKQAADYELRPAPDNPGLYRDGPGLSISEQMKEAQKLAAELQIERGPGKDAPDRGGDR